VTILNLKDPLKYFFLFPNGIAGRKWVKIKRGPHSFVDVK